MTTQSWQSRPIRGSEEFYVVYQGKGGRLGNDEKGDCWTLQVKVPISPRTSCLIDRAKNELIAEAETARMKEIRRFPP
jgi:hypothetical protein